MTNTKTVNDIFYLLPNLKVNYIRLHLNEILY